MSVSILGRGQAPAARRFHRRFTGGQMFQSSAGDKPRPLAIKFKDIALYTRFNPRPGTSPGRSMFQSPSL